MCLIIDKRIKLDQAQEMQRDFQLGLNIKLIKKQLEIIIFLLTNKPLCAAVGPENSVPAIGWVARKFSRFGWSLITLQILFFVEPKSITKVFLLTLSKIFGSKLIMD